MKLIVAGVFDADGVPAYNWDGRPGTAPVGIERVIHADVGVYHVYLTVDTNRRGTHFYKWFVNSQNAEVEWVKPRFVIIRFYDHNTKTFFDGGFSLVVYQEVPNGATVADENLKLLTSINPDSSIASVPHPFGDYPQRGVASTQADSVPGGSTIYVTTDFNMGTANMCWFYWYSSEESQSSIGVQGDLRTFALQASRWVDARYENCLPNAIQHIAMFQFGEVPEPDEVRIVGVPATLPVGTEFTAFIEVRFGTKWVQNITPYAFDGGGSYLSSDENVVACNIVGQCIAASPGIATISTTYRGLPASFDVTVTAPG